MVSLVHLSSKKSQLFNSFCLVVILDEHECRILHQVLSGAVPMLESDARLATPPEDKVAGETPL